MPANSDQQSGYITLNEGDSSYHFLFDENPSLSFIINYERLIQDVNKKACTVLGYKKSFLIGRDPLDIIHPAFRSKISDIIDELFNREAVTDIDIDIITSSGTIKKILFAPGRLVEYNKHYSVLLNGIDVSEAEKKMKMFEDKNELFSGFMDVINTGIFICDEKKRCIYRNKFLSDKFNSDITDFLMVRELNSDMSVSHYVNLKDKNNIERYCEVMTFSLNLKDFKDYTGGILTDITDKIENERLKRENETVFKTVYDNSGMGIVLADLEGKIMECNPAFQKLIGFSSSELRKKTIEDITHPFDYETEKKFFEDTGYSSDAPLQVQKRFLTKDKEIIWVNLTAVIIKDDEGKILYRLNLVENITERKAIKEALQDFEYRNKAMLSALPDMIFILDSEGYYLDFSAGNSSDLAMDSDKLIGSNISQVFSPEQFKIIINKIITCLSTGEQQSYEYDLVIEGEKKIFETRIVKYNDTSVLALVRNITDLRLKEQQLQKYADELSEINLAKDRLFSIISHDLRSPFHALLGLTEILDDDLESLTKEEIRRIGKELHQAFKNQYSMLENLLAWSRIQKDNIDVNPEGVNLSEIIDEAVYVLQWSAERKNIRVSNLVRRDKIIHYDPKYLQSIIQNLISNAIKFSDEDSTVKVELAEYNNLPSVEISDEGIGLSDDEITRLLSKPGFTKPGTASEKGSGLGLIICREFIEKHGGELYIKSKKGKGTTVGFTFKNS